MERKTLTDRVLDYMLEFGSITTWDAFRDLGVTRLSAYIFILRNMGYQIESKEEKAKNRYGDPIHYSRYTLIKGD